MPTVPPSRAPDPRHGPLTAVSAEQQRRARCAELLAELQETCPGFLGQAQPAQGVKPGEVGPVVALDPKTLAGLLRSAVMPDDGRAAFVWSDADDEVVLHADGTQVATSDGIVAVALRLECVETDGPVEVVVPFAVGTKDQLAGMIAATEVRPRGPAILVDRWGEAIVAMAWQALLDVADGAAAGAGQDIDWRPLRAGALVAGTDGLTVTPQAPHDFEREAGS